MDDNSIMPFGKYQGKRMEDVPASYLLWLYSENKTFSNLRDYIEDNLEVLQKQERQENQEY